MIRYGILLTLFFGTIIGAAVGRAQVATLDTVVAVASAEKDKTSEKEKEKKKAKEPEFDKVIEDYQKIEGFFTLYWSKDDGKVYLEIKPEEFDKVYLCNVTRQSGDGTMFDASAMLDQFPFVFHKSGKQIQLIQKNVDFRAAKTAALNRALQEDLSNSIISSTKVASQPNKDGGGILVDASDLFLIDYAGVGYQSGKMQMSYSFDKSNSHFVKLKSFPQNTEIEVALHFKSSKPYPIFTLPDSRSMLQRYHYSLSMLPETGYQPRVADDRVGLFTTIYQDYTSLLKEDPYKRYVNRWQLEKAEPKFNTSKPKQPIVFWLENTIPVEYRDAVREGVLEWNKAFEKIGFEDAIVVKQMPDDADWDPADVRYTTIRWIVQPGGGYAVGPHRANPYTGQIYDADVRVSADYVRAYYRDFDEFITPLSGESPFSKYYQNSNNLPLAVSSGPDGSRCSFASGMEQQIAFGWNWLLALGRVNENSVDLKRFMHDAVKALIVHEVGHTLGLRHNFKASSVYSLQTLAEGKQARQGEISGSVMDYNPIYLNTENKNQKSFFQTELGPYDYWAIEYAYKPLPVNSKESESALLDEIAAKGGEEKYRYGTDEDAFGFSTRGMDPSCNLYDLGTDPIGYYDDQVVKVKELWKSIPQKFDKKGQEYQKYRQVFSQGIGQYYLAALTVPKFIGGIYMHRDHIGDPGGHVPFEVVPAKTQRQALQFVLNNFFSENAFHFSPDLLKKLAPDRKMDLEGTVFRMQRLDYPIHGIVQLIQSTAMFRLYDPLVLQRMQDSELMADNNTGSFTMPELFTTIRKAVWSELETGKNINSFRRELQRMHLYVLNILAVASPLGFPHDALTLARADLVEIKKQIDHDLATAQLDAYTTAHLQETAAKIDAALGAKMQLSY